MASAPTPILLLVLALSAAATTASAAGNCSSLKFSSNRTFKKCRDLPTLSASIHWTYRSRNGNLSMAFVAPPAAPAGWVAWGINPIGDGMVGTQALLAFKQSDGSMGVKTYNITAYGPIAESPIDFQPSGLATEAVGGAIQLFGTLNLGAGKVTVNQVWQVGSSVTGGVPDQHAFGAENLGSKGRLNLGKKGSVLAPAPAPEPGTGVAGGPTGISAPAGTSGGVRVWSCGCWSCLLVAVAFVGAVLGV